MKRVIILIAVLALMCGTAFAAPVLILNGTVDLHATAVSDGTETDLTLRTFQLLGQNADGSYLIHFNQKLFNVAAADMTRAIVFDAEVPALGALETLSRGDKGDQVVPIQEALKAQSYLTGSADGDFGPGTERAVTAFQEANGLEPTGQADEITQLLLRSPWKNWVTPEWQANMERIEDCIHCGACASRCPYGLKPYETLPEHLKFYREFVKTHCTEA